MIADFLLRLAIALPVVLLLAVALLLAARRGWVPSGAVAPAIGPWCGIGRGMGRGMGRPAAAPAALDIVAQRNLSPALRLAVVRYAGEELLVGVAPQGFQLLARRPAPAASPAAAPAAMEESGP